LPGSALLGALLIVGADTLARVIVAPAELPIGVVTSHGRALLLLALAQPRDGATMTLAGTNPPT
jgi:iron complex transport system permease protein